MPLSEVPKGLDRAEFGGLTKDNIRGAKLAVPISFWGDAAEKSASVWGYATPAPPRQPHAACDSHASP